MYSKIIVFIVFLLALISGGIPQSVHAQAQVPFDDTITVDPAKSGYLVSSLAKLITTGARWAAGVGGIILFFYLVWGGAEWILSGGDKSKVEAGKARITQSIIGFAILACVFIIYGIVVNYLGLNTKVTGVGGAMGGAPGQGGGGGGAGTCNVGTVGQMFNDGGAGGYCTGAAMVKCVAAGQGPAGYTFPHFEPCYCATGTKAWNWQVCP